MSLLLTAETPEDLRLIAARIGSLCGGGEVVVLSGDLGAGKTTFTQGLALGLGITERVTSPTFVISRLHTHPSGGVSLVHVDAYRVGSAAELDDLDLGADLSASVVVVEWGRGIAEDLSPEGLDIVITRSDSSEDERRTLMVSARGRRWAELISDPSGWAS